MENRKACQILLSILMAAVGQNQVRAQMVTYDPIHTTVTTIIKFFQEPSFGQLVGNVKKLVQISKFIRQVGRGVELAKEATTTLSLINNYGRVMAADRHILSTEYAIISKDFVAFAKEVAAITTDLAEVVQQKNSSMDDGHRLKLVNDAFERLQRVNGEIRRYVGRINYISQRRSFGAEDKAATARLYNIASEVPRGGGSSFSGVGEFPGYTYGNQYDNEDVDFDVERRMAQEAAMVQQKLYQEYETKLRIAELEAESLASLRIPKTTQAGFFSIKMNEGACPMIPQLTPHNTFLATTMHYDSASGATMTTHYEDKGKNAFDKAVKDWEYQMEEICGPLWDAYVKRIDFERNRLIQETIAPLREQYQKEMNEKLDAANQAIAQKYQGQTTTKAKPQ